MYMCMSVFLNVSICKYVNFCNCLVVYSFVFMRQRTIVNSVVCVFSRMSILWNFWMFECSHLCVVYLWFLFTKVWMCVSVYTCKCKSMYMCMCVYLYLCISEYMCMWVFVYDRFWVTLFDCLLKSFYVFVFMCVCM